MSEDSPRPWFTVAKVWCGEGQTRIRGELSHESAALSRKHLATACTMPQAWAVAAQGSMSAHVRLRPFFARWRNGWSYSHHRTMQSALSKRLARLPLLCPPWPPAHPLMREFVRADPLVSCRQERPGPGLPSSSSSPSSS